MRELQISLIWVNFKLFFYFRSFNVIIISHVFPKIRWDQSPECCWHTHSHHFEVADRHPINFSRLPKVTADGHPKGFLFQFPPSDPVVPDTWGRHRHNQAVESNLPDLRVLPRQGRLQASHCIKSSKHEDLGQDWLEFRTGDGKAKRLGSIGGGKSFHGNQAEVAVRWFRRWRVKRGSRWEKVATVVLVVKRVVR